MKKDSEWNMTGRKPISIIRLPLTGGNPASQSNIGNSYYKGDGIEQNYDRAVKYFTLAMERGVPNALFALGDCCYEGKGLEKDLDKARNGTGKPLRPDMSWMRKTGHT